MPGTELNKISAMFAIKLVGYCTVSCLRRDIGGDYAKMEIEGIFEKLKSKWINPKIPWLNNKILVFHFK